jgi:hypothetical protein
MIIRTQVGVHGLPGSQWRELGQSWQEFLSRHSTGNPGSVLISGFASHVSQGRLDGLTTKGRRAVGDFKLEVTREIDRSYRNLPSSISTEKVRDVAGFFVQNMNRVLALSAFPLGVFNLRWMQMRESGEIASPSGVTVASRGRTTLASLPPSDAARFAEVVDRFVERGLIENQEQADIGVQAILSAMVIGTWTAFESMAGDLWMAAIDSHPRKLAELAGGRNRIKNRIRDGEKGALGKQGRTKKTRTKAERSEDVDSGSDELRIRLSDIHKIARGNYNLSGKMGQLLAECVEFDSLVGIREAYSRAFPPHTKLIDSIEEALSDRAIDVLGALRNLLVHDVGIINDEYQKKLAYLPKLPIASTDKRIYIDGAVVKQLIDPVIGRAVELIKAVDRWIKSN